MSFFAQGKFLEMNESAQMKMKLPGIPEYEVKNSSSFTDNMQLPVHRWFRFSAGFSAEWVKYELRKREDVVVLDPFSGSGTTLISADEWGVRSIGVDAHPFVARIAQAKLKWDSDVSAFESKISQILTTAKVIAPKLDFDMEEVPSLLQKSYYEETLRDLFALKDAWRRYSDKSPASELAWLALTAILRSCSYVGTAPWQYVLPHKRKSKVLGAFEALQHHSTMMKQDMEWMQSQRTSSEATMIRGDARDLKKVASDSIDLVITSPPYANNYDYADATRLELTYWGIVERWSDLQSAVRKYLLRSCSQHAAKEKLILDELLDDPILSPIIDELGPVCRELADERHLHGGKKKYHLMVAAYFADMARVWNALHRVCKNDSEVCFVLGDSAPYGIHVPVDKWLAELAHASGFEVKKFLKTRDRNVKWRNRTHTVPLKEGQLWLGLTHNEPEELHYMEEIASPGHKLGQMIGNFFEDFFSDSLSQIADKHGVYCDSRGRRPEVRGNRRKVTWSDQDGNPHDLDYVLEYNGSPEEKGDPAAFIELAWRRYTKHSRNKAGEIEGALLHLGETYPGAFLGAILGGEFTQGSLDQLESHEISVLYIPFQDIADAFLTKGVNLNYDESANDEEKQEIISRWRRLSEDDIGEIRENLEDRIRERYNDFLLDLEECLARDVASVRIFHLFGEEVVFTNIDSAVEALNSYEPHVSNELEFMRFEIQIRFSNGDHIMGCFEAREKAIDFLRYGSSVARR